MLTRDRRVTLTRQSRLEQKPCNVSSKFNNLSRSAFVSSSRSRSVSVKSRLRLLRKNARRKKQLKKKGFSKRLRSGLNSKKKLRREPAVRKKKGSARLRQQLSVRDRCRRRDLLRSKD